MRGLWARAGMTLLAVSLALACGPVVPGPGGASPTPAVTSPGHSPSPSPQGSPSPSPPPSPTPPPPPSPSPTAVPPPAPAPAGHLILIDISDQHLWAYAGSTLVVDTVVATGRPELPTVTGTFHILAKYSPFQFVSPWPPGSPYWYASAWVSYAMLFEPSGYFIHDAPWRTVWGPGANLTAGSHGCVNVPLEPMARLYAWTRIGDTVVVRP